MDEYFSSEKKKPIIKVSHHLPTPFFTFQSFFFVPIYFFLSFEKNILWIVFSRLLPDEPKNATLPFKTNKTKKEQKKIHIYFFFHFQKKNIWMKIF